MNDNDDSGSEDRGSGDVDNGCDTDGRPFFIMTDYIVVEGHLLDDEKSNNVDQVEDESAATPSSSTNLPLKKAERRKQQKKNSREKNTFPCSSYPQN